MWVDCRSSGRLWNCSTWFLIPPSQILARSLPPIPICSCSCLWPIPTCDSYQRIKANLHQNQNHWTNLAICNMSFSTDDALAPAFHWAILAQSEKQQGHMVQTNKYKEKHIDTQRHLQLSRHVVGSFLVDLARPTGAQNQENRNKERENATVELGTYARFPKEISRVNLASDIKLPCCLSQREYGIL